MDFENFCKENFSKEEIENVKANSHEFDDLINKYKGKSKEELFNELIKVANNEKSKGKLSRTQLDNIFHTLSPYLSESEKQNLKKLINIIG